ncbi:putative G-protein coupled receptor 174 [Oculina patagonica]
MGIDKEKLIWTVLFAVEMLIVIIGNSLAIAVFWKQRSTLKRTCYLLINLSVADFLVGIGEIGNLAHNITSLIKSKPGSWDNIVVLDIISALASLAFLTLISMERLYAVARPFQHRATTMRVYIYFIAVAWSVPGLEAIIYMCSFGFEIISKKIATLIGASYVALCLVIISCSYLTIWKYKRNVDPRIPIDRREQNKKLAMTLFIVSFVSVLSWLPISVSYMISFVVDGADRLKKSLHHTGRFLMLTNSIVNPVVYYARMPEFRRHLRNIIGRQKTPKEQQDRQIQNILKGEVSIPVLLSVSSLNTAF